MSNVIQFTGKYHGNAPAAPINSELVGDLEQRIQDMIEEAEQEWCNGCPDHEYLIGDAEDKEILDNFRRNFVSGRHDGYLVYEALASVLSEKQIVDLLRRHSYVEDTNNIYIRNNELYSAVIGEMAFELDLKHDTEIQDLLAQASAADLKAAGIDPNNTDSLLTYGRPCERLVWCLDVPEFWDAVEQLGLDFTA
jgi:hypothetical protein